MKIGLIDVDGHNFPNIPLMKLSAWHKKQGDQVEWYDPMFSGHMDKVYMSKVFSFTPDFQYHIDSDEIIKGGSGYCISVVDGKEKEEKHIKWQIYQSFGMAKKILFYVIQIFLLAGNGKNCCSSLLTANLMLI